MDIAFCLCLCDRFDSSSACLLSVGHLRIQCFICALWIYSELWSHFQRAMEAMFVFFVCASLCGYWMSVQCSRNRILYHSIGWFYLQLYFAKPLLKRKCSLCQKKVSVLRWSLELLSASIVRILFYLLEEFTFFFGWQFK